MCPTSFSSTVIDTSACPLCGQKNLCAVANGLPAEQCWCMQATIPANVLEQIPEALRRQSCVCPACGLSPAAPR